MSDVWFSYDYNDGFITHATEQEAIDAAQHTLQMIRKIASSDEEWPEEVDAICYGRIVGRAVSHAVEGSLDDHDQVAEDYKLES